MSDNGDSDTSSTSVDNNLTVQIARALASFLSKSAIFACGGAVPIQDRKDDETSAAPVTIRWDSSRSIKKLTLPLSLDRNADRDARLAALVRDTQPAGFGLKGKDVVDESYRKASKLDPTGFSTNFCPYEAGIVDAIAQALLPTRTAKYHGVRAELYKLNVYRAPSGLFKAHVDTPRSTLQFGSLVVCLPCAHEGGQLVVRHDGHSRTFDWTGSSDSVQWAAFFSDCEHEVLEVTSGYRLTLTYNLYACTGLGQLGGNCTALESQQLPLYEEVKNALANPQFMPDGGTLGQYCRHAYAHTTKAGADTLPQVLKGSDMVAHEVFSALGVDIRIRPVLDHITNQDDGCGPLDKKFHKRDHVGMGLGDPVAVDSYEQDSIEDVYAEYPHSWEAVTWLNGPRHNTSSVEFAYLRYGNEASIEFGYSYCALLFNVLSYAKRVEVAKAEGYTLE
ncbi:hypothetical protein BDV95DRAFT_608066 [Massariosphaeria phaeospora]|uniref:Fe2OG dioxygenase domain-containing protein n=1 Tax=Massariosphaeria phaeospora TaxID=100035 RepID=A0A7C8M9Y9_9PLEO|nr:hypothetical protein BDV95DRAFT_608066 [Massariosphaeria phaeospora]